MSATKWSIVLAVALIGAASCRSREVALAGAIELRSCRSWSVHEPARCGAVVLPERRDSANVRVVRLGVVILPKRVASEQGDPILFISGGPGLAATHADGYVRWALEPLRASHDLVMIDVRGTGDDAPLSCNLYGDGQRLGAYIESMFPLDKVRECAAQLSTRADLTQYTTETSARDLDDVRAALHVDRWSLFGGSYGTRLALEYMRLFPDHVRRAALLGVLPPEAPIGRDFARGGELALDSAIVACAADAKCRAAAPKPRADITTLLDRLRSAPARANLWNASTRSTESVTLTAREAQEALFVEAYQPATLARVLPLVHDAIRTGEMKPLIQHFVEVSRARRTERRDGVALSVYCAEDAPRLASADSEGAKTLLGAPTLDEAIAACQVWPHGTASPAFGQRVVSSIPTLLMSGGRDPATPWYLADSAALGLSRSERYIDPGAGHAFLDERARARLVAFLAQRN